MPSSSPVPVSPSLPVPRAPTSRVVVSTSCFVPPRPPFLPVCSCPLLAFVSNARLAVACACAAGPSVREENWELEASRAAKASGPGPAAHGPWGPPVRTDALCTCSLKAHQNSVRPPQWCGSACSLVVRRSARRSGKGCVCVGWCTYFSGLHCKRLPEEMTHGSLSRTCKRAMPAWATRAS